MIIENHDRFWLTTLAVLFMCTIPTTAAESRFSFSAGVNNEFAFDTGVLRGKLRAKGKTLGLTGVIHMPSGKRLDRSNGLLSHYRVFSNGSRHGAGAWDWPSEAVLNPDGSVHVSWPSTPDRHFRLAALYRLAGETAVDVHTTVTADANLKGFESFLACYFSEGFTNAAVYVAKSPEHNDGPGFLRARKEYAEWQMFPRDKGIVPLIQDGRWKLEPHPVNWTMMPAFAKPIGLRRDLQAGISAVLMSKSSDVFAIGCPHETESHYSVYFSQFGADLKQGESRTAVVRLLITGSTGESELLKQQATFSQGGAK